ncbi:sensor histidine kinase [Rudanella paleaurantiibacter]|uniref:histidine kinase n=1 Tax=Rudanella paleaurantiibacter TaxID=2614655 RepID=A0A7J5U0Y3_9BACT|nr:sensor histidine kinase [Rudanella paleaurantiibacter]KAB7731406.1 sensor histidine kinase [Rudanella paleaurantiibacter]
MAQSQESVDLILILVGGSAAMILLVVGVVGFILLYQKRIVEQELLVKQMELNYQQAVVYQTLDAVEDERKRVARDLHDEVGAALSAMRLLVGQIGQTAAPGTPPAELSSKVKGVIDNTIDNVRRISNDLLPQGLNELGLAYALEGLCETAMNLVDVDIRLTVDEEIAVETRTSLILYRLVQELLNNAVKYAEATELNLQISQQADGLLLEYSDNGKGFDFSTAYQKKSLGLKNIETRAQMLNGTATFVTKPGAGLHVTVRIPQPIALSPTL